MGSFKNKPNARAVERHETRDELRVRKLMLRTLIGTFDLPLSKVEFTQAVALGQTLAQTDGEQDRLAEASASCVRRRRRAWFWWAVLVSPLTLARWAGQVWRMTFRGGISKELRTAAEQKAITDQPVESRHRP